MVTRNGNQGLSIPARDEFDALVKRANGGDAAALDRLRALLNDHPEIWHAVGDLFVHAKESLIARIARDNQLLAESLRRTAAEMEVDYLGQDPTRLEKTAVQRIVVAWLELQLTDSIHPDPHAQPLAQTRLLMNLKNSAQRRLDSAIKSFALVKTLLPGEADAQLAPDPVSTSAPAARVVKLDQYRRFVNPKGGTKRRGS